MKVYQYIDENKMEAAQGFNDDCVMSLAIACKMFEMSPTTEDMMRSIRKKKSRKKYSLNPMTV